VHVCIRGSKQSLRPHLQQIFVSQKRTEQLGPQKLRKRGGGGVGDTNRGTIRSRRKAEDPDDRRGEPVLGKEEDGGAAVPRDESELKAAGESPQET
jgi:hypothetical protein